ncbi:MAG: class I SAM-dependent methyltransferase [Betaproteobacteria bacterium]
MDRIEALLERANALVVTTPAEAASLYATVQSRDPANLVAHNALEHLRAAQAYGRWMHVNCIIDPRDDIFRFFATHALAKNPVREYLSDGWRTMSELMQLLERLDRPLMKMQSVLEFAAGFGRFTRHLSRALPQRVTCTDIQPGSVEFLRDQFGVDAFYSASNPEEIVYPRQYELIFVLSLFTHLPVERWGTWLKNLHRGLAPGGLLVFSVHNEIAARQEGVRFDPRGVHFISSSESPQLGAEQYGTTFTTDDFLTSQVKLALGCAPLLHERLAFWVGQDAVVISA